MSQPRRKGDASGGWGRWVQASQAATEAFMWVSGDLQHRIRGSFRAKLVDFGSGAHSYHNLKTLQEPAMVGDPWGVCIWRAWASWSAGGTCKRVCKGRHLQIWAMQGGSARIALIDTHEITQRGRTSLQLSGISEKYAWGQFASNYYWHRADNRL